jgi:hypothetical protein
LNPFLLSRKGSNSRRCKLVRFLDLQKQSHVPSQVGDTSRKGNLRTLRAGKRRLWGFGEVCLKPLALSDYIFRPAHRMGRIHFDLPEGNSDLCNRCPRCRRQASVAGHVSLNSGCHGRGRAHEGTSGSKGRDGDWPTGSLSLAWVEGSGRADRVHPCSAGEGGALDAS